MNEKILFFDIDGTLLGRNEYLPESAVEAIKKTRAKGNLCFICSGRSKAMLPKKLLDVGFDGIICGGGTYISFENDRKDCFQIFQIQKSEYHFPVRFLSQRVFS